MRLPCVARSLPPNLDGSSCFMNSVLVALLFPDGLRVLDALLLLQPHSRPEEDVHSLRHCLSVVADSVRGRRSCSYSSLRGLVASSLHRLTGSDFSRGQHDALDFLESLFRAFRIDGLFRTVHVVNKVAKEASKCERTHSTHAMYRQSMVPCILQNRLEVSKMFPFSETVHMDADTLIRTSVHFAGGPVLVLTRESVDARIGLSYGSLLSGSTNGITIEMPNVRTKGSDDYLLQSVVCWSGMCSSKQSSGHYVCYVYSAPEDEWFFFNDLNMSVEKEVHLQRVPPSVVDSSYRFVPGMEVHGRRNQFRPSTNGCIFVYSLL